MEYNDFEKHIRRRFLDQEEHVDVSKIMSRIPVSDKKRNYVVGIIFFSACVSILIFSSFYFLNQNPLGADIQSNNNLITNTSHVLASNSSEAEMIISNTLNETKNNSNFEAISGQEVSSMSEISNNSAIDFHSNIQITSTELSINKGNQNKNGNMGKNTFKVKEKAELTPIENNKTKISNLETNQLTQKIENQYLNLVIKTISENETFTSELLTPRKISSLSLLKNSAEIELLPKTVNCPTFGSNPWITEVGMVLGVSNPKKSLDQRNTEINPAYSSRVINEKSLEGLDLELFLSAKRARWPVFLKSGINYSRWSERMKLDNSYSEIDTVQGVISSTVSQTGDTITYIYGDIYVQKDFEIKKTVHYYLHRFDIPLSIVYEKEFGNNTIQIESGTRINLSTLAQGKIYNRNLEFSNASYAGVFKKFSGISYFGKLHYRYYHTPTRFIGVNAYFQYLPADFASQYNSISQKYSNYGIGVYYGIRF